MKNKISIAIFVAIMLIALPNINCSKNSDSGNDFFVPILENQWVNKNNPDNTFLFNPVNTAVNTSTFTGTDDSTGRNTYNFSGSFTNHNFQFTYDNNSDYKSGKTYSGTINDASNVLTLHSNDLGDL